MNRYAVDAYVRTSGTPIRVASLTITADAPDTALVVMAQHWSDLKWDYLRANRVGGWDNSAGMSRGGRPLKELT